MKNFINRALVAKKHLKLFFALFAMLALCVGNAWGAETATGSWDLTTSSSEWTSDGCVTYFSQPYGIKKKGAYIINKNISDFINYSSTATNIEIGVKSLCNGATTSVLAVSLVDVSGNVIGASQTITPDNASAASKTTYKYVTFTSNLENVAGYKVECTTFGKNVLINGTSYEITYTPSSGGETPGTGGETPGEGGGEDPETPETGGTVTYTVSTATAVTTTGNVPQGSTAVLSGTGSLNSGFIQCSNGKNHTLTLTGYEGYMITGVTIHVKSNSSKGTGSFSVMAGSTAIASITESAFNTSSWNGSWNTTGVDKTLTMTNDSYKIQSGENVTLTINCKSGSSNYNSLYVKSYTITYKPVSSSGSGTEEPVDSLTAK